MAAPASSHGMIKHWRPPLLDVQALIDAAPASSMLLDRDGRILTINRRRCRLGLAPAQALGLYLFDLFPVEVAASRQRRLQAVTASRQPQVFEDHRDGQHYRTSAVPVMDRDGEVPGGDFSEDITAQHEAERLLRDSPRRITAFGGKQRTSSGSWTATCTSPTSARLISACAGGARGGAGAIGVQSVFSPVARRFWPVWCRAPAVSGARPAAAAHPAF